MNCKPGDIAIIVKAKTQKQYIGRIVTVKTLFEGDAWICEPDLVGTDGLPRAWFDSSLRPIRPTDGEDETLQWAGKPNEVTA